MAEQELIVKINKEQALAAPFLLSIFVVSVGCGMGRELFIWKRFNPDVLNTIWYVVILLLCLIAWLNYYDNRPRLIFNEEGIWRRKNLFCRSLTFISWSKIKYFYIDRHIHRGVTETLIVEEKDSEKIIRIILTGRDLPYETMVDYVKERSLSYGFYDLGHEES
jgi:hypothetical protein